MLFIFSLCQVCCCGCGDAIEKTYCRLLASSMPQNLLKMLIPHIQLVNSRRSPPLSAPNVTYLYTIKVLLFWITCYPVSPQSASWRSFKEAMYKCLLLYRHPLYFSLFISTGFPCSLHRFLLYGSNPSTRCMISTRHSSSRRHL